MWKIKHIKIISLFLVLSLLLSLPSQCIAADYIVKQTEIERLLVISERQKEILEILKSKLSSSKEELMIVKIELDECKKELILVQSQLDESLRATEETKSLLKKALDSQMNLEKSYLEYKEKMEKEITSLQKDRTLWKWISGVLAFTLGIKLI